MLREQWSLLSPAEETVLKGVACIACRSVQIGVCAAEHVARPGRLGPARGAAVGRPLGRACALRLGPPIVILRLPAAAQSRRRPRILTIAASLMPPFFAQLQSLARTVHQPQQLSQPSCASTDLQSATAVQAAHRMSHRPQPQSSACAEISRSRRFCHRLHALGIHEAPRGVY